MTEESEGNQATRVTKVKLEWTEREAGLEPLDYPDSLDLVGNRDLKGPKEIKVKKAKRVSRDKKEAEDWRAGVVLLVPEEWWAERDRREFPGWTESQGRTAVKACRENTVMTGRPDFLAKLDHVVKLAFQDSQGIRGPSDQRVSRVFGARADQRGKEASRVGWDCRGHKESRDLKDNLVTRGSRDFREFWEFLDRGGRQETLGQRAYGDQKGRKAQWAEEELWARWGSSVPTEAQVLEEKRAVAERLGCRAHGGLLDLVDPLDFQVGRVSRCPLRKTAYCLWIHTPRSGLRINR